MLFKALALLTLGIGNTLAVPSFAIKSHISPNVYRSESTFEEMKNGDYSLNGKGSVTDELTSYGVDTFNYSLGVKDSTIITVSEASNCVYVYLYSKIKSIDYDKISLCAYSTNVTERIFTEYEMSCVSYNVNKTLSKYEIFNLDPSESYHSYTVREAYVNSNKDDMNYIIGSSCSVAFNPDNNKSRTVREDCVNVTKKVVAYELAPGNQSTYVYQSNYCAFSIDRNIEDITKVNVGYYSQKFGGVTNISLKRGDDNVFPYVVNKDLFYQFDSNNRKVGSKEYHNDVIGAKEQELKIYDPRDIFKWFGFSFDTSTIKKVSDVDLSKFSGSESIDSYQYLLRFDLTKFRIGYDPLSSKDTSFATIGSDYFVDNKESFSFNESNAPIQVTDFTIFQLWFLDKGEEKDVIVVDTYSDTIGGSQIQDPTGDDVWSQIMSKIVQGLKQFFFWLMNNWWAWLIVGILLLPVAYPVSKIVWFLLKCCGYIIALPFKLLIHLFGGD